MGYRPLTDFWFLARPKVRYYGAYPNGFLERARALLGVTPYDTVLHVCGGKARDYPAKPRGFGPNDLTQDLDLSLAPDYGYDAATIPLRQPHRYNASEQCDVCMLFRHEALQQGSWECLPPLKLGAVIMDPPYTPDDADHYAPGRKAFPKPNAMIKAAIEALDPGRRVGMLHYVLPQPPRKKVRFVAAVGVVVGFNNRIRIFSVFEKEA